MASIFLVELDVIQAEILIKNDTLQGVSFFPLLINGKASIVYTLLQDEKHLS